MNTNQRNLLLVHIHFLNVTVILKMEKNKKSKNIKKYSAQWLLKREEEGFSHKLLKEIHCEDTKLYKSILRMTPVQFAKILEKVRPLITKHDTSFRKCIGPEERLHLTLRYLATGESQTSLQLPFRIHQSTISKILKESIPAIYFSLRENFLQFPKNQDDWLKKSKDFYTLGGFPNCIGAIVIYDKLYSLVM